MDLSKYFEEAEDQANGFFYFDDYEDDMDFADDDFDFDGDDWSNAGGQQADASTSQPYIVNVENTLTTSVDISDVVILGAYTNLQESSPAYGNTAGISITMGISNITYKEFLYQSMNRPFIIGLTYLTSTNDNQVLETLTLKQKDVNGNVSEKVLTPTIDPYQFQSGKIAMKYKYQIDGFTSITISKVLAKTSTTGNVKLYFYPAETVSTARSLSGRRAVRGYGSPHVERSNKLTLSKGAMRGLKGRRR
jgi:hypothetical protein